MTSSSTGLPRDLEARIQGVARQCQRARWVRCWLRFGWVTFLLTCCATVVLAIVTPDGTGGRVLLCVYAVAEMVAAWRWLVRPLRKPIPLEQVALYIDEHHPELENRMASAVDFGLGEGGHASAWLIERFLEETGPMVQRTSFSDLPNARRLLRLGLNAFFVLAASLILVLAFTNLWLPGLGFIFPGGLEKLRALPFVVEPGSVRVRRGDNQMVWAASDKGDWKFTIRWKMGDGAWQGGEMAQSEAEEVHYHQFINVQSNIQYWVQSGRRRSETFVITAWTPPEIDSIDLTYHYPEYLGEESREVPNSGNITAIEGTKVDLAVWVNKALARAELVLDSGGRMPLEQGALEEGEKMLWTTQLVVAKNDKYHIELADLEDAPSEYDPEYTITARRDLPPKIRIDFPRGDSEVTLLEEVPFNFEVSDDYGFTKFGLQYEVAGREPVRVELNTGDDRLMEAKGHHELMLETLGLEPGDFITWTVFAEDAKPDRTVYQRLGDPYFLEIRPFQRRYQEAVSGRSQQGGGGGEGEPAAVQKDIIIATWKLRRDSPYLEPEEFEERRSIIIETQLGLREKLAATGGLMGRARPEMVLLRKAMTGSVEALERAELPEPEGQLSEATVHQQQAYRLLLKLRPKDSQVRQSRSQRGGGAGGASNRPDIQALEMDRNRNFYEEENRTQEELQATEEVLNKIKQLAQRQQIINEEIARLISELQNAASEEERERIQRKLDRIEEEQRENLERLDEVQQAIASGQLGNRQSNDAREALQRARRQMNKSLEQLQQERLQQARASGARAMEALGDIKESLKQFSRAAAAERMKELLENMDRIKEEQEGVLAEAERLRDQHDSPSFDEQEEMDQAREGLLEKKAELSEDFVEMMSEASELAERARETQELMARELGDWLRETSREGILEDISDSQKLVHYGIWDSAVMEEKKIARKLDDAAEKLKQVARNSVEDDIEGMQKALEYLDEVLEDGEERTRVATNRGEEGDASRQDREEVGTQSQQDSSDAESNEGGPSESSGQPSQEGQRRDGQGADNRRASAQFGGPASGNPDLVMQQFAQGGYQWWLERLRNAEALLPRDVPYREQVVRIREEVETIRRRWRERGLAPRFDLFLEMVVRPLEDTAEQLQRDIERRLNENEFILVDEGDIPERYKEKVADYFKKLSESGRKG